MFRTGLEDSQPHWGKTDYRRSCSTTKKAENVVLKLNETP